MKIKSKIRLFSFFLIEILLLTAYTSREIQNTVPLDIDSTIYLNQCYKLFAFIHNGDWKSVTTFLIHSSQGGVLILRTAMFFLFGYNRMSAVVLNEVFFVMMQVIGCHVFYKLGNWRSVLYFISLTISENILFAWSGDLTSPRFDFIAFCIYGIWVLTTIQYLYDTKKENLTISAASCGLAVFCRFFSALFIAIIVALLLAFRLFRKKNDNTDVMKDFLYYLIVAIISGGWFFLINLKSFFGYYLAAFNGPQASSWQVKLGVLGNIRLSAGYGLFVLGKAVVLMCVAVVITSITYKKCKAHTLSKKYSNEMYFYLLLTLIIPVVIYTVMANKQALTFSIVNIPIIAITVCVAYNENRDFLSNVMVLIVSIISCVVFISGVTLNRSRYSDTSCDYKINDIISEYILDMELKDTYILYDRFRDTCCINTVQLLAYEKGYGDINVSYAVQAINGNLTTSTFTDDEFKSALEKADIIVVNENGYNIDSNYLTDQLLSSFRTEMLDYAQRNYYLLYESPDGFKIFSKESM